MIAMPGKEIEEGKKGDAHEYKLHVRKHLSDDKEGEKTYLKKEEGTKKTTSRRCLPVVVGVLPAAIAAGIHKKLLLPHVLNTVRKGYVRSIVRASHSSSSSGKHITTQALFFLPKPVRAALFPFLIPSIRLSPSCSRPLLPV